MRRLGIKIRLSLLAKPFMCWAWRILRPAEPGLQTEYDGLQSRAGISLSQTEQVARKVCFNGYGTSIKFLAIMLVERWQRNADHMHDAILGNAKTGQLFNHTALFICRLVRCRPARFCCCHFVFL